MTSRMWVGPGRGVGALPYLNSVESGKYHCFLPKKTCSELYMQLFGTWTDYSSPEYGKGYSVDSYSPYTTIKYIVHYHTYNVDESDCGVGGGVLMLNLLGVHINCLLI